MIRIIGTDDELWEIDAADMTSDGHVLYDLNGPLFTSEDLIALAAFLLRRENRSDADKDVRVLVGEFTRGLEFTEQEDE